MPAKSPRNMNLATGKQSSKNSVSSKSIYWLTQYPWKDKNNSNKGNAFIERFDSWASLQSADFSSSHLATSDSSTISHQVIPPTSPVGITGIDPPSLHQCNDPFACAEHSRRTRSLMNRTHVLSYLPPFRVLEEVSPMELQARRLSNYFQRYPHEVPAATASVSMHRSTASGKTNDHHVRQHSHAFSAMRHARPCTRSHSLSSFYDYPQLTESEATRPACSRSCSRLRVTLPQPSNIGVNVCYAPIANSLEIPQNVSLDVQDSPSISIPVLTECDVELPQDSFPSSCSLAGGTDWSVCLPCTASVESSSDFLSTLPDRVSVCHAPPSPYVDEDDACAPDHETLLANRGTHPVIESRTSYPIAPTLVESQSSDLVLPDPPSGGGFRSVTSTQSVNWPPTPLELLTSPSPVALISPDQTVNRTRCTVSHHVVNILILPTRHSYPSVSPTLVSPPTEVVIVDSMCDKVLETSSPDVDDQSSALSTHVAHARARPAQQQQLGPFQCDASKRIDGFGDRFMSADSSVHSSFTSSTLKSKEVTYRLQSRSASPQSKRSTPSARSRGDCVLDTQVASPYSLTGDCLTYSRKTPPHVQPQPRPLFRTASVIRTRSRRRSPTIRPLRTPCLSAIYASIRIRPLSTTRRRVHSYHSTSLDCVATQRARHLNNLTRSRPELNTTESTEQTLFFSRVFAVPDVSGLQKSVSCFGSPISPSLVRSLHNRRNGISGTHGRPTDRRLYCVLQRYPGSRAEMLQEVQRAHGQHYAFLVLHTLTWANMFSLVRDLDRVYPHWQLARQLSNTRSVMARATSRSVLALNQQIQPILSPSNR